MNETMINRELEVTNIKHENNNMGSINQNFEKHINQIGWIKD